MLATELNSLLRDSLSARSTSSSLFEECLVHDQRRPLLIVLERSADIFPVLQHNALYQALIADVLDLQLNRVTVEVQDKGDLKPLDSSLTMSHCVSPSVCVCVCLDRTT
jgi:sec1 family domain-containing protein 1